MFVAVVTIERIEKEEDEAITRKLAAKKNLLQNIVFEDEGDLKIKI